MADTMNLHAVAKSKGWAVFALADGHSDNVPYEDISDAYRAMKWDRDNYLYLQIPAGGADPAEMQACLDYARMLHDAGCRLPDPRDFNNSARDFPFHHPPVLRQDWARQISNLIKR
jgi:hypothetical protein